MRPGHFVGLVDESTMFLSRLTKRGMARCMRVSWIVTLGISALTGVLACSGSGEPSGPAAQTSGSVRTVTSSPAPSANVAAVDAIAVGPLKITIDGKALELKEDGVFSVDGKTFGTFSKNEVKLAYGQHVLTVAKNGGISVTADIDLNKMGTKFTDKNGITTTEKGDLLTIEDDGKVMLARQEKHPVFTGFKPELRRAACLMIMLFLVESDLKRAPAAGAPAASGGAK